MRIVKRAGQSGYDPGGYIPSGRQKPRQRKSEHDRALAGAKGTPYSEGGSGLGAPLELQQRQIVILVNRDDLCDAGLPVSVKSSGERAMEKLFAAIDAEEARLPRPPRQPFSETPTTISASR
jgi:hypothetical protein